MENRLRFLVFSVLFVLVVNNPSTAEARSNPTGEKGNDKAAISAEEYRLRRQNLMKALDANSIAVFMARQPAIRSNDVNYRFRQENNFLYLTGLTEPGGFLLLSANGVSLPDGSTANEILFVTPSTPNQVTGSTIGIEGAKSRLGFATVLDRESFRDVVAKALEGASVLYYNPEMPDLLIDHLTGDRLIRSRQTKTILTDQYPNLSIKRISRELAEMRMVKSGKEIELMQHAIDATVDGHIEAMKSCEPGMYEFELQAIVEYCFGMKGSEYPGFPSIIGSGPNSCILHYEENTRRMEDGDLVVLDIGAEYQGYSADVTRTIPVNGTFSKEQRELYDVVLRAQKEAIALVAPGVKTGALNEKAREIIGKGLKALNIIEDEKDVRTYFIHGVSHPLGLDVHDVGVYGAALSPGVVITVEPGIYIPEGSKCDEKYWNIGIRIEDDVLVTEQGHKVLSDRAPRSADEIEKLMKKKGIGNEQRGSM